MLKVAVLLSCVIPIMAEGYMRVCYFSNWAQFRPVPARMTPGKIDPKLCTHLIYAFAKLDFKSELSFTEWNDGEMVKEFTGLKKENPYLKTLLAVGGYNQGSKPFSDMTADKNLRKKFVRTTVEFLKQWNFDGLDLDWEYPAGKGGRKNADKRNYVNLLKELRDEIDLGNTKLSLSIAVPSGKDDIDKGFDVSQIVKYVDFINLMSYDIHGDWEKKAGHNSPLYPRQSESGVDRQLNVDWAANYLLEQGAPKEKLIVGLPTYGRHYKLSKKSDNGIGAPIRRAGKKGPYTKEDGFLAYYEVCELLETGQMKWDDEQQVPYLLHKDHWIGYDNEASFLIKLEFIKEKGYGGASVWNIDLDDFDKLCPHSSRVFPLISLMAEVLGEYMPDDMSEYTPADNDEPEAAWNEESVSGGSDYKRVCYFTNWAQYRTGPAKFKVSDVDPFLCTHLIYAFAKVDNYQLAIFDENDKQMYKEFKQLKTINPELKTLIAVGGWSAGSEDYSNLVSSDARRQHFARYAVDFLVEHGFDGLDLDWEYPAARGGKPEDKTNFIKWIKDIRGQFDSQGKNFLLTAAVAAGKSVVDKAYNIPEMAKYLDFINLMSYDLHGSWEKFVGHNSPLFARIGETEGQETLNVDWAARYWVSNGLPKSKLIIGLPTYGRSYTLVNMNNNDFGDAANGPGPAGQYTKEGGMLAYYEVCQKLGTSQPRWHDEHMVPFFVNGDEWIGYDDEASFLLKLDYIKREGYGGAMVWAMDLDDFGKLCPSSSERYPLMSLIKRELGDNPTSNADTTGDGAGWSGGNVDTSGGTGYKYNSETSSTNSGPSWNDDQVETNPPQTQLSPQNTFDKEGHLSKAQDFCKSKGNGHYAVPFDCAKFLICSNGKAFENMCATGLYWNEAINNCDWKSNVNCGNKRSINNIKTSNAVGSILRRILEKLKSEKQERQSLQGLDRPVDSVVSPTYSQEKDLLHADSKQIPEPNMYPPQKQNRNFPSEDSERSHLDSAGSNLPYMPDMQHFVDRDTDWLETSDTDIEDGDSDEDYIF